jgi:hypothetical protein
MSDLDEFLALVGTKCVSFTSCKRDWMGIDGMECPFVVTADTDFHSQSLCPTETCTRPLTICDCGEGLNIWGNTKTCMIRPNHTCPKLEQAEE